MKTLVLVKDLEKDYLKKLKQKKKDHLLLALLVILF